MQRNTVTQHNTPQIKTPYNTVQQRSITELYGTQGKSQTVEAVREICYLSQLRVEYSMDQCSHISIRYRSRIPLLMKYKQR